MTDRNGLPRDFSNTLPELRASLTYNPETGIFTWREKRKVVNAGDVAGHLAQSGYVCIVFKGRIYFAHRLAWAFVHGATPNDKLIDHINNVRNDNRIANLRLCNRSQNRGNASTYRGVGMKGVDERKNGRFRARITYQGNLIQLGTYDTIAEASHAYMRAAKEYFGEFASE